MTREEYIDFANALKNNYTIDFDKLPEFCDMAISALSENKGEDSKIDDVLDRISAEINTPNRGTCDYFIVDRIEQIISEYHEGGVSE